MNHSSFSTPSSNLRVVVPSLVTDCDTLLPRRPPLPFLAPSLPSSCTATRQQAGARSTASQAALLTPTGPRLPHPSPTAWLAAAHRLDGGALDGQAVRVPPRALLPPPPHLAPAVPLLPGGRQPHLLVHEQRPRLPPVQHPLVARALGLLLVIRARALCTAQRSTGSPLVSLRRHPYEAVPARAGLLPPSLPHRRPRPPPRRAPSGRTSTPATPSCRPRGCAASAQPRCPRRS